MRNEKDEQKSSVRFLRHSRVFVRECLCACLFLSHSFIRAIVFCFSFSHIYENDTQIFPMPACDREKNARRSLVDVESHLTSMTRSPILEVKNVFPHRTKLVRRHSFSLLRSAFVKLSFVFFVRTTVHTRWLVHLSPRILGLKLQIGITWNVDSSLLHCLCCVTLVPQLVSSRAFISAETQLSDSPFSASSPYLLEKFSPNFSPLSTCCRENFFRFTIH